MKTIFWTVLLGVCLIAGAFAKEKSDKIDESVSQSDSASQTDNFANQNKIGLTVGPPPSNKTYSKSTTCFSSGTRVITQGGVKYIKDLVLGDNILVESPSVGDIYHKGMFTPFVSWLHRSHNESTVFIDIISSFGSIVLSPEHFLYASKECNGIFVPTKAEDVEVGWCLQNPDGDSLIYHISRVVLEGYYAPYIVEDKFYAINGDDVRNAIAVSPYAKFFPTTLEKSILSKIMFINSLSEQPDAIQNMPFMIGWILEHEHWFLG